MEGSQAAGMPGRRFPDRRLFSVGDSEEAVPWSCPLQQARSKRARLSLLPAQFRIEIDFIRPDIEPD